MTPFYRRFLDRNVLVAVGVGQEVEVVSACIHPDN